MKKALQICATPLFSMNVDLAKSEQEGLCKTHVEMREMETDGVNLNSELSGMERGVATLPGVELCQTLVVCGMILGAKVDAPIVKDMCQTNPHKHSNTETSEMCQTQTTAKVS